MKQRIKLGDVYMDAMVNESPSLTADITDKPVEFGTDISDHMKLKPYTLSLSGTMVNDAASKLITLRNYQRDGKLLRFVGRTAFDNVVISSINTRHVSDAAEGYHYDISLVQVRLAKPKRLYLNAKPPSRRTSSRNISNKKDNAAKKFQAKLKEPYNAGRKQLKDRELSDVAIINMKNAKENYMQGRDLNAIY